MTTDQLLLTQPATANFSLGANAATAGLAGESENSEVFLKTLLQKIKALGNDAAVGPQVLTDLPLTAAGTDGLRYTDEFAAFVEQVKILAGQSTLSSASGGGKKGDDGGNILPLPGGEPDALMLTPEQIEQLMAQLLHRPLAAPAEAGAPSSTGNPAEAAVTTNPAPLLMAGVPDPQMPAGQPGTLGHGDASASAPTSGMAVQAAPSVQLMQPPVSAPLPQALDAGQPQQPAAPLPSGAPAASVQPASFSPSPASGDAVVPAATAAVERPAAPAASTPAAVMSSPFISPAVEVPSSPKEATGDMASLIVAAASTPAAGEPVKTTSTVSAATPATGLMTMAPELLKVVAAGASAAADAAGAFAPTLDAAQDTTAGSAAVTPASVLVPPLVPAEVRPAAEAQQSGVPVMNTPFGRPGWSEDLGERVVWMTGKGVQSAELQLNPQHLGPVEVRIDLKQDQASIQFVAHHAGVRDAIEAAIPKLREMLGAQQLNLADVSVAQQSLAEQRDYRGAQPGYEQPSQSARQGGYPQGGTAEESAHSDDDQTGPRHSGRGLLNLYA